MPVVPYKLNYFEIETGIDAASTFVHSGDLTAAKLIKDLGTSNDILLGDGTTFPLSSIASLTAFSAVSPLLYNNTTGVFSIQVANASQNGYLSSTDWTTFNSKQGAITLTTTGTSGAATLVGNTLNVPNYTDTGITTLNTLTALIQTFAVGSAGTDFAINSATSTHTFNLPTASAINRGALSSADWSTFNSKQGTITLTTTGTSGAATLIGATLNIPQYTDAFVGTVTSVSALTLGTTGTDLSSTVANSTTTPVITLNVPTASAANRGALSSTDWTTFNSKQDTITLTTTGSSGASTFISNTLNVPTYTLSGLGGVPTTRTITINGTSQDLSADRTYNVGTVTSVGLTMPAAFSIANSPVTSAGTIAITGAGLASQYIRGDGALGDFPNTGGGGSSVSYYLNGSVSQGTFVGNTYYEMNKTPVIGTGTDFTIGADGYIAQFITDANDPAALLIPGGNWNVEMYFSASSSGGTPSFYVEVYKYNGTTFTLLGTSSATPEGITNGTAIDIYYTSVGIPETVLTITDRLAIRVYVTHSGKTITLHTEDNHLSEIVTTFSNGLTALNGLTKQAQYFAVGSAGTDFNIASSVDTHTFNIPDASATARGLITTGTQTIAGAKTLSSTLASTFVGQFLQNTGASTSAKFIRISNTTGDASLGIEGSTPSEIAVGDGGIAYSTVLKSVGSNSLILGTLSKAALTINTSQQVTLAQGLTGTTANFTGQLTLGSTITNGTYTYTLPSATGTLALTSDIHSAVTLSAIGSTANANGATLTGQVLNLQPASASFGGVVTTIAQTFAGDKTLTGTLYGIGLSMTGTVADIVQGTATSGKALRGTATTGWGLYASATTGVGVQGNSSGTGGSGVYGSSGDGYGGVFYNDSTTYPALEVNNNNESAGNIAVFRRVGTSVFIINSLGNISNGTYTYTLPSATGTLALTSALSGYLPLTGGTLTGSLTGTSATFNTGTSVTPNFVIAGGGQSVGGGKGNIRSSDTGGGNYWDFGRDNLTTGDFVLTNLGSSPYFRVATLTGAATFASLVNASGIIRATSATADTTGSGAEIAFSSGIGYFLAYNRSTSAYLPVGINGSTVTISTGASATVALTIASTGAATFSGSLTGTSATWSGSTTMLDQLFLGTSGANGNITWDGSYTYFNSGTSKGLSFGTNNTINNRLVITSGGNVLIGSSTDGGQKFQVTGNMINTVGNNVLVHRVIGATTGYNYGYWTNTSGSLLYGIEGSTAAQLQTGSTAYDAVITTANATGLSIGVNQTQYLRIASTGAATFSSTITTTATGKFGAVNIRVTSPTYDLQLSDDSAAKPSTNTWTIASDSRVKENITPYTKGLSAIMAINPVNYDYNGKAGFSVIKGNIGLIAQDVLEILPESVSTYMTKLNEDDEEKTELYNFNSHALTYILINAIKEQQAQIEELKALIIK